MRRRLLACLIVLVLPVACTPETETVSTFTSGDVEHELGIFPNDEGPEAPCVGLSAETVDAIETVMTCPTDDAKEDEYAGAFELAGSYFVVGYGLAEGDEIEMEDAMNVVISEETRDRRFFAIQLDESPGAESFQIPITASDGTTRSIMSYGVGG